MIATEDRMAMRYAAGQAPGSLAPMELRHLRYFVAVAEELHFRRAAERLHIAQPAVSEQVRNLERELGVQLFERTQRSVTLTAPGSVLLEEARRVLRVADDAARMTRQAQAGVTARLRVGRGPDVLPMAVPRALRRFSAGYPDVDVTVEPYDPREAIEAVRRDLLDVAIVCLPAPVSGLRVTPIGEEGVVVALPEAHPGTRQTAFPLAQLDGAAPIMLPRDANPPLYDGILAAARDAGITIRAVQTPAPTVEQALVAAASGRSPALLAASVAARHTFPGVRFLPLEEPAPTSTVALVSANDVPRAHTARFLRLATAMAKPAGRPVLTRAA
jgi:DNA-binding transcriptional LysR family regulator